MHARLIDNVAIEIFTPPDGFTLAECFHAEVAQQFVECPEGTLAGATYDPATQAWTNPEPEPARDPEPAALPKLSVMVFYLAFTPQERIAIKSSADPEVKEFWSTYELAVQTGSMIDPNLASVRSGLEYLVAQSVLASEGRIDDILAGRPQ